MKHLKPFFDAAFKLHGITHKDDKAAIERAFVEALQSLGGCATLEECKDLIFDVTAASL